MIVSPMARYFSIEGSIGFLCPWQQYGCEPPGYSLIEVRLLLLTLLLTLLTSLRRYS